MNLFLSTEPAKVEIDNLKLVSDSNPVLKQVCPEYAYDVRNLFDLAKKMFKLMRASKGVGLAAPQVGLSLRLFIINTNKAQTWDNTFVCVNPSIRNSAKESDFRSEGCLTWPGKFKNKERPKWVEVEYFEVRGKGTTKVIKTLHGIAAQCFLHELEHLEGKTLF